MKSSIQLVIADSSEVFIEGIRSWVTGIVNIEIARICRNWDQLSLFLDNRESPLIVVTQCRWLVKIDPDKLLIFKETPGFELVAFCSAKKKKQIIALIDSGVSAFFNPGTGREEFIYGLFNVAHGLHFVSKGLETVFTTMPGTSLRSFTSTETNSALFTGN
jgi:hypothetical protein